MVDVVLRLLNQILHMFLKLAEMINKDLKLTGDIVFSGTLSV